MRRWGRLARSLSEGDPVSKLPEAPRCDGASDFGDFGTIGTALPDPPRPPEGHFGDFDHFGTGVPNWDEDDWQATFDERAAIVEFDGGLSREGAERAAAAEIAAMRRVLH
jgi:hypothetical protein